MKNILGYLIVIFVCLILLGGIPSLVTAPSSVEKFGVTFNIEVGLTHKKLYITVQNLQDSSDNLDFNTILNETNFDITRVTNLKYSVFKTNLIRPSIIDNYGYVIYEQTYDSLDLIDAFTLNGTTYVDLGNQSENVSQIEEIILISSLDSWIDAENTIFWSEYEKIGWYLGTENYDAYVEETFISKTEENRELKHKWEQVAIQKNGQAKDTIKILIEWDTPIVRTLEGWGNKGTYYIEINGDTYVDMENSSWWDISLAFRTLLINSSVINPGIPYAVNDNRTINGSVYWTTGGVNGEPAYIYYDEAWTGIAFANGTTEYFWENSSTLLGANPEDVWNGYNGVWLFDDENSDGYNDSTSSNIDMIVSGTVPSGVGKIGNSSQFNGNLANYLSSTISPTTTGNFSVLALVRSASLSGHQVIGGTIDSSNEEGDFFLRISLTSGNIQFFRRTGSGTNTRLLTADDLPLSINTDYCLAGVWNGTDLSFYVDAVKSSPSFSDTSWTGLGNIGMWIGKESNNLYPLNGNLSFFAYIPKTLSQPEINQFCQNGIGNFSSLGTEEILDTTPSVTITSPTNTTFTTSGINFNITVFEGGTPIDSCFYSIDDNTNITLNNVSGNWNDFNSSVPDGNHNVRFHCNDTEDNFNSSEVMFFTIDTTLPTINFISPSDNTNTSNTTWFFTAFVSDKQSVNFLNLSVFISNSTDDLNVTLNQSIVINNSNNVVEVTISKDGVYIVFMEVFDNDSKSSRTGNITIRRDTVAPSGIVVQSPSQGNIFNITIVDFNISAVTDATSDVDSCWFSLNGGDNVSLTNSSGTWNFQNASMIGKDHSVKFFCNDTAGNVNTTVPSIDFAVILVNLLAPADGDVIFGLTVDHIYNISCDPCINSTLFIEGEGNVSFNTSVLINNANNTITHIHDDVGLDIWTVEVCSLIGCTNATEINHSHIITFANFSFQLKFEINETDIVGPLDIRIRDPDSFALLQTITTDTNGFATANLTLRQYVFEAGFSSGSTTLNRRIFKTLVIDADFDVSNDNLALINATGQGGINMYLPSSDNDVLLQTFILNDLTTDKEFSPGNTTILRIRKVINGTDVIMHQDFFDVENKLPAFLLADNKYKLTVDNGVTVRDLGFKVPSIAGDEIILNVVALDVDRALWAQIFDTASGGCSFNNITLVLTCTFVDTSTVFTHSTLNVWQRGALNWTRIINNVVNGSDNIHSVSLPDNTSEYYVILTAGTSPDLLVFVSRVLSFNNPDITFGLTGVIASGFIIMGAGLMGASIGPIPAVAFAFFGFLISIMLRILAVGTSAIISSIAVLGALVMWRLSKR